MQTRIEKFQNLAVDVSIFGVVLAAMVMVLLMLAGCGNAAKVVTNPATSAAAHTVTETPYQHIRQIPFTPEVLSAIFGVPIPPGTAPLVMTDTQIGATHSESRTAAGKGEGIDAEGPDSAKVTHNSTAPTSNVGGADEPGASGGDSAFSVSVTKMFNTSSWFLWVGLGCILVGGGLLYFGIKVGGLSLAGLGVFLIAAGVYPWLLIPGVLLVVGGVAYEGYKHGFFREGGRALVADAKTAGVLPSIQNVLATDRSQAVGSDLNAIKKLIQLEA